MSEEIACPRCSASGVVSVSAFKEPIPCPVCKGKKLVTVESLKREVGK